MHDIDATRDDIEDDEATVVTARSHSRASRKSTQRNNRVQGRMNSHRDMEAYSQISQSDLDINQNGKLKSKMTIDDPRSSVM